MNRNTELRNLPSVVRNNLTHILSSSWTDLMGNIPKTLGRNGEVENSDPKYLPDEISLLKASGSNDMDSMNILLDEWSTSGRIRPTLEHLLNILIKIQSFRAADYIAQDLLNEAPPQRPTRGPAAHVPIPLDDDDYRNSGSQLIVDIIRSDSSTQINSINQQNNNTVVNHNSHEGNNNNSANYDKGYSTINKVGNINPLPIIVTSGTRTTNESQPLVVNDDHRLSTTGGEHFVRQTVNGIVVNNTIQNLTGAQQSSFLPDFSLIVRSGNGNANDYPNLSIINPNQSVPNSNSTLNPLLTENTNREFMSDVNIPAVLRSFSTSTASSSSTSNDYNEISHLNGVNSNLSSRSNTTQSPMSTDNIPNLSLFQVNESVTDDNSYVPNLSMFQNSLVKTNSFETPIQRQETTGCNKTPSVGGSYLVTVFNYEQIKSATNNFNDEPFVTLEGERAGRKLGSGGFGDVYLGVNVTDDYQLCAIKKLKLCHDYDKFLKQFTREIEVLSKHRHNNLIELLGYSRMGDELCLVYEYISGGNLYEKLIRCRLNRDSLDWRVRIQLAKRCADGIAFLHSEEVNVVHRDIKSANILLASHNVPKICDFGLIKSVSSKSTTNASGTNPYMAPECVRGVISTSVDIFAFGVVLLELLTGLDVLDQNRNKYDLVTHYEEHTAIRDFHDILTDWKAGDWGKSINQSILKPMYDLIDECLKPRQHERKTIFQVKSILDTIPS